MFLATRVETTHLSFVGLAEEERRLVRANLIRGSICEWQVDAYDSAGKCIGETLENRRFLVAEPLLEGDRS
jgi:hypothetical protein